MRLMSLQVQLLNQLRAQLIHAQEIFLNFANRLQLRPQQLILVGLVEVKICWHGCREILWILVLAMGQLVQHP